MRKIEKKLPRKEIARMISKQTKIRQYEIEKILDTYHFILIEAIKKGFHIHIPLLGTFGLKEKRGRDAGTYWNPRTQTKEHFAAIPDYKRPQFDFSPTLIREIRSATEVKRAEEPNGEQ